MKLRRLALRALLPAALVVYVVSSWMASSWLLRPHRSVAAGAVAGVERHEPFAETVDGMRIFGQTLRPASGTLKGVVLLFHGKGGARLEQRQPFLRDAGFTSIAVDLRAHGESSGEHTSFGWDEAHDVRAVVSEARRRNPDLPVFAWGVSLGGAAMCFASEVTKDLAGLVLESVYARIDLAYERRLRMRGVPDWLHWLGAGPYQLTAWRLGVSPSILRPEDHVDELIPERLLLVTGSKDERAPVEDLDRLSARSPRAPRYVVEGAHHRNLWSVGGEAYRRRVLEFFEGRPTSSPR